MSIPALGTRSAARRGRNLISGNVVGVMISGAESEGNVVLGNLVGPAITGGAGAGNTVGIYLNGAPGNIIGGTAANVISGNASVGVYILGSPQPATRSPATSSAWVRWQASAAQPEWDLYRECPGERYRWNQYGRTQRDLRQSHRGGLHPWRPICGQSRGVNLIGYTASGTAAPVTVSTACSSTTHRRYGGPIGTERQPDCGQRHRQLP